MILYSTTGTCITGFIALFLTRLDRKFDSIDK